MASPTFCQIRYRVLNRFNKPPDVDVTEYSLNGGSDNNVEFIEALRQDSAQCIHPELENDDC